MSPVPSQSAAATPERRNPPPQPIELEARTLLDLLTPLLRGFKPQDILTARHHSEDFVETRAEYILVRLRFMVLFYALAVPLWIPLDYFLISAEHFMPMMIARFTLAGVLLPLGLFALRKLRSRQVHASLALAIAAPSLFYVAAMLILAHGVAEPPLAGYTFMPFLMIAMLGVFPLTLAWSAALIGTVVAIHLGLSIALGQFASQDTIDKLWVFALFGGITLWIQAGQLLMLLKLYRESTQDPLTGLINRRVLMKRLVSEISQAGEAGRGFCILMFDLDRFKRINDNHGHLTGDAVLKTTAKVLIDGLRGRDILARFGGEEFVAVLPGADVDEAIAVAERIRQQLYETQVSAPDGSPLQLSTSVGVTRYEPGEAIEAALSRVDDSLYRAKELGRNRVIHSQSGDSA